MWKWMGLFLGENHLLRCWGWLSFLNWIRALTLCLLLNVPPRKLKPWFVLWSFFLLRLLSISIHQPYGHAWDTVVMLGLVLLVATWNWLVTKTDMQDYWSFPCCLSWTLGSSLKCSQLNFFLQVLLWWMVIWTASSGSTSLFWREGLLVILIDCMISLSILPDVTRMLISTVPFIAQLDSEILRL